MNRVQTFRLPKQLGDTTEFNAPFLVNTVIQPFEPGPR